MIRFLLPTLALAGVSAVAATPVWTPLTWHGEASLAANSGGWRAIVSLPRARLMYFGPAASEYNLLLAPPTRANRNILGGHRLWLGPQAEWSGGWPPPAAWEYSAPDRWSEHAGVLRLELPEAGDGWPRLVRTYHWNGSSLVCGAEISGGARPAQIIQIFQVPAATVAAAEAAPAPGYPAGYVQLPSLAGPFATEFPVPPHLTRAGNDLQFHHVPDAILKVGVRPQPVVGSAGGYKLTVRRGELTGRPVGEPDQGFYSQIYLGGPEALVELEQLSPRLAAGEPARFEAVLQGTAP